MTSWFIRVIRDSTDPFNYPHLGKVQYFRIELKYHDFAILEHPDYPGPYRARFIVAHPSESRISYMAMKYHDRIPFLYDKIDSFA